MAIVLSFLFAWRELLKGMKWVGPVEVDSTRKVPQTTAGEGGEEYLPILFLKDCRRFVRGRGLKKKSGTHV